MQSEVSRRHFLGLAATCAGGIVLASHDRSIPFANAGQHPASAAACKSMVPENADVLLAYATRCGSTAEIAEGLAKDIRARGYMLDVAPCGKISGISAYRAVIVGSAVRGGRWLPEAVSFVHRHRFELSKVPTAFFAVHIMNTEDDKKSRNARMAYLNPVRKLVRPEVEAFFAGKLDLTGLGRMMGRLFGMKCGDLRNWSLIHRWGNTVFCSGITS